MSKLHPLHTVEQVANELRATGKYLGSRGTGRTTAACLAAIAKAIMTPGKPTIIEDPDCASSVQQKHTIQVGMELVCRMDLRHLHFEITRFGGNLQPTVVMENRLGDPSAPRLSL